MADLVALAMPAGPRFVDALRRVWDAGDAVFPLDLRLPDAQRRRVLAAMAPARLVDGRGGTSPLDGARPVEPGDALVLATSGTTGTPKGVVLTHDAVAASARATSARLGVRAGDHWLSCLPLAHVGGLSVVTRALVTGTGLTVLAAFDPVAVHDAVCAGANLVSLVNTALRRVDPAWFRAILLGGAKPPDDPPPNAVTTYGMTETGSGCVYDGVPLDGVEVRIDGAGAIGVRAALLLRSYRDGTVPLDSYGWFRTGDLGEWGADGRLVVHGREGDLIVTGGENVWPDPVEAIVGRLPGVAEVAVAGVPHPEWGHEVTAFVVPVDGAEPTTLDALRDAVRAELPSWCAPRRLELVRELPRTALGKVQRAALVSALIG
jgi:o-succinylbenzoate---CoA ligase